MGAFFVLGPKEKSQVSGKKHIQLRSYRGHQQGFDFESVFIQDISDSWYDLKLSLPKAIR